MGEDRRPRLWTGDTIFRVAVPTILLILGGLAWYCAETEWGEAIFWGGVLVSGHTAVEFFLVYGVTRSKFGGGSPQPVPKMYYESLRFAINALVVTTGLVLGLVINNIDKPDGFFPIIVLGFGIYAGLINLNVSTGAIHRDYTGTKSAPDGSGVSVAEAKIEIGSLHATMITVLFNMQIFALIVAIAGIIVYR